jgi:hypothetical protein
VQIDAKTDCKCAKPQNEAANRDCKCAKPQNEAAKTGFKVSYPQNEASKTNFEVSNRSLLAIFLFRTDFTQNKCADFTQIFLRKICVNKSA